MRLTTFTSCALAMLCGLPAYAQITTPGDPTLAIDLDFGGLSRYPDGEPPLAALDGSVDTKYLNFGAEGSGLIVTPDLANGTIATGLQLATANDAEGRDPTSYELYGTSQAITTLDNGLGTEDSWSLISSGVLSLPSDRKTYGSVVNFSNTTAYDSYRLVFPTLKGDPIFQISEIDVFGDVPSLALTNVDLFGPNDSVLAVNENTGSFSDYPGGEPPADAIDGNRREKYLNRGGANSGFIVTPSVGPTTLSQFRVVTANDNPQRDPASYQIFGTNDVITSGDNTTGSEENWTLIQDGELSTTFARMFGGDVIEVSNDTAYSSYRVVFPTLRPSDDPNSAVQVGEVELFDSASFSFASRDGSSATGAFDSGVGWSGATAPAAGAIVNIGQGDEITLASGSFAFDDVRVGVPAGSPGEGSAALVVTGGSLSGEGIGVGGGSTGVVTQIGGVVSSPGGGNIGFDGGDGRYVMSSGALNVAGRLSIAAGEAGTVGRLEMSGDATVDNSSERLVVAAGPGSVATLSMTDNASIVTGDISTGDSGGGSWTIALSGNATLTNNDDHDARGEGIMTLRDNASYINIDSMRMGNDPGTTSTVDQDGPGTLFQARELFIGRKGAGVYNLMSGTLAVAPEGGKPLEIGRDDPRDGSIASGTLNISGGTLTAGQDVVVGKEDFTSGELVLGSGSVAITDNLVVGRDGADTGYDGGAPTGASGIVMISGGTFAVGQDAILGFNGGVSESTGEVMVSGGDIDVTRDAIVGFGGSGSLHVVGDVATIDIGGDLGFGGDFEGAAGGSGVFGATLTGATHTVVNVNGGTEGIPGDLLIFDGSMDIRFGDGFTVAVGDYSAAPLEWEIIDFEGSRNGAFDLASGYLDGSLNGGVWGIRYDDAAGEVFLQLLEVIALQNPADFNGDGSVDLLDLDILGMNFDMPGDMSMGDANGDGFVDLLDLDILGSQFGMSATATIPEPASVVLMGGLLLAGLATRRR